MSHTTMIGKLGWVIHNGDWSGDAEIWIGNPDASGEELLRMAMADPEGAQRIVLPGAVALAMAKAIVAEEFEKIGNPLSATLVNTLETPTAPPAKKTAIDILECGFCGYTMRECVCQGGPTDPEPAYEPLMPETPPKIEWTDVKQGPPKAPSTQGGYGALLTLAAARLHGHAAAWAATTTMKVQSPPDTRAAVSVALEIVANVLRDLGSEPAGPTVPIYRDALLLLDVEGLLRLLFGDRAGGCPTRLVARRAVLDSEVYIDGERVSDPESPITQVTKETFVVRFRGETRIVQVIP